jgi:hypothetical protein
MASLLPCPCQSTGRSSGGQLGDDKDVGSMAGEGSGFGSGLAPWGMRTVAAPIDLLAPVFC